MFFVLTVEEKKGGLLEKLHDRFNPPEVTAERITPEGGLDFFSVTAKTYRGSIPWSAVSEVCGKLKKRALLPSGITPDPDCGIRKYAPRVLPERILFNSALRVLRQMQLDPARVIITVIDENAYVVDMVEKLCPAACAIRVVTSCVREYECLAERLMSKYGLSLVIAAKADDSILRSTVIISPSSLCIPLTYRGILFTNEKRRMMNAVVLSGGKITLPEKYRRLLPENVDPLVFAGALYELCAVDELGRLEYDSMTTMNEV